MGRQRTFDDAKVLDAAMKVFWQKGYDAASLNHLVEATGIERGSLYQAYGSKSGLFRACIKRFRDKRTSIFNLDNPAGFIREFFYLIVSESTYKIFTNGRKSRHGLGVLFIQFHHPG